MGNLTVHTPALGYSDTVLELVIKKKQLEAKVVVSVAGNQLTGIIRPGANVSRQ